MKTGDVFRVVVDYSKSLATMIKAGKYNWHDPAICESHFSVKSKGKEVELDIELIHYGKFIISENIIRDMERRSLRPAKLPELLAFAVAYPEMQYEFPIVALGSVWRDGDGYCCVACLRRDVSGRGLYLSLLDGAWRSNYRFAAVRK